jgi:tRNA A-37 threonylcarbamoyl transferase component Bud32
MDPASDKTVVSPRSGTKHDLFQAGDVVGQYRIERVLGAGGMGVVYLVQHTALRKHFALKALPATLAQEASFVARFKREAEMLARLKHGHIVNVTDFGESQGRLYLVLEFVDGGSLEDWFAAHSKGKGTGAPPEEVWRLIGQVLQGLVHAHHAGIVHRDLKPANVLLEKTGEAKISDFGLARVVAEEEYRRTGGTMSPFQGDSVTTTGTIVGTIDFMSPEARNMQASDARSDIYAVGVITYYLLTGRKPHGLAQPASKLVAGLDPRWDKFIKVCLALDPAQRYQTAREAAEALRQIPQRSGGRRWLGPAVAAVLLLGGTAVWLATRRESPAAPAASVATAVATPALNTEPVPVLTKPEAKPASPEVPAGRSLALTGLPPGAVVTYQERNHSVGDSGPADSGIAARSADRAREGAGLSGLDGRDRRG